MGTPIRMSRYHGIERVMSPSLWFNSKKNLKGVNLIFCIYFTLTEISKAARPKSHEAVCKAAKCPELYQEPPDV